jgi:glyoxylase-like metal-dependent hydrolase (beta-lactamase superfamily II)
MQISGIDLQVYTLPIINSNMFVLVAEHNALIIDPLTNEQILKYIEDKDVKDIKIILTHEHFDHISGVNYLRECALNSGAECTVYAGVRCADSLPFPERNLSRYFEALFITKTEAERRIAAEIFDSNYHCEADVRVTDGYELKWNDLNLMFRETPGHSPGSICVEFYNDKDELVSLATGDSLVQGNKVITRIPGGSKGDYQEIMRPYLESFGPDILVLPGHGSVSYMRELELG